MSIRLDPQTQEVTLPAFFTITSLAQLGRMTRYTVRLLLANAGVHRVSVGRRRLIPVAEIERKIPLLYKSLHLLESARRARKQGKSL